MKAPFLLLLCFTVQLASAVKPSLQFICTGVTSGTSFPEFTLVGLLNGEQIMYYDSNIQKMIPKTDWMKKEQDDDPKSWNKNTQWAENKQEDLKTCLAEAMQSYNHTERVHTVQGIYGCELHDDRSEKAYARYAYDGEDFLSLYLDNSTYTAATPQAIIAKQNLEASRNAKRVKEYLMNDCPEVLKMYEENSRDILERKVPPQVSLFQKNCSSPLVCHATGFFPKALNITWQKNGVDLEEDVDLREMLPNQDGTFQKRSMLTVSPEELDRNQYTCVIQHARLETEVALKVDKVSPKDSYSPAVCNCTGFFNKPVNISGQKDGEDQHKTNHKRLIRSVSSGNLNRNQYTCIIKQCSLEEKTELPDSIKIIIGVVVAVLLLVIIACIGVFIWKKKRFDFTRVAGNETPQGAVQMDNLGQNDA